MKDIALSEEKLVLTKELLLQLLDEIQIDINTPMGDELIAQYPEMDGQLQIIDHLKYTVNRIFI